MAMALALMMMTDVQCHEHFLSSTSKKKKENFFEALHQSICCPRWENYWQADFEQSHESHNAFQSKEVTEVETALRVVLKNRFDQNDFPKKINKCKPTFQEASDTERKRSITAIKCEQSETSRMASATTQRYSRLTCIASIWRNKDLNLFKHTTSILHLRFPAWSNLHFKPLCPFNQPLCMPSQPLQNF